MSAKSRSVESGKPSVRRSGWQARANAKASVGESAVESAYEVSSSTFQSACESPEPHFFRTRPQMARSARSRENALLKLSTLSDG